MTQIIDIPRLADMAADETKDFFTRIMQLNDAGFAKTKTQAAKMLDLHLINAGANYSKIQAGEQTLFYITINATKRHFYLDQKYICTLELVFGIKQGEGIAPQGISIRVYPLDQLYPKGLVI